MKLLKIGIPIGFAIFFETSIFAAVTLLMSHFDTVTIASHQAAMNFASLLYMLPLSVSMTLTIVVGFEAGAKRFKDSRTYSYLGISIAVGFSLFTALIILLFREQIAGLYAADRDVLLLTKDFLLFALFFSCQMPSRLRFKERSEDIKMLTTRLSQLSSRIGLSGFRSVL